LILLKRRSRSLQPHWRRQEIFRSGQTGVPRPDADIQVGQRDPAAKVMTGCLIQVPPAPTRPQATVNEIGKKNSRPSKAGKF